MTNYKETSVSKTFTDAGFIKMGPRFFNPMGGCILIRTGDTLTLVAPGLESSTVQEPGFDNKRITGYLRTIADNHPEYFLASGKIVEYTGSYGADTWGTGVALFRRDQISEVAGFYKEEGLVTEGIGIEIMGIPHYAIYIKDGLQNDFLDWINENEHKETVSTAEHLGAPGATSGVNKTTEAINKLKEETKAKERQRAISSLKRFLNEKFTGTQAFNTEDLAGDSKKTVYHRDGIKVLYCSNWDYLEIFGLSTEEFKDLLKDPNDFFGDHIRIFSSEEMGYGVK